MGRVRSRPPATTPFRSWRTLARRLPIVILAALAAAVPGGGAMAVSRVNDRPDPPDRVTAPSRAADGDSEDRFGGELAPAAQALETTAPGRSARPPRARLVGGLSDSGIPAVAMLAYTKAQQTMAVTDPSCGIRWSLLAAIGRVESNHGRFGGARLYEDGDTDHPIRGVALNGVGDVAHIADTDDGRLDGDRVYDRAVGPMQFIPSTWRRVATDGNDDGRSDPNNIYDAALGAAVYLCAGDTNLRDLGDRERAVLRYNRSREYAATVLSLASAYERGHRGPLPVVGPTRTPPAIVGTPSLPPANPGPTPSLGGGTGSGRRPGRGPTTSGTTTTSRPLSTTTTTTRGPSTSSTTARPPSSTTTTTTRPPAPSTSSSTTSSTTTTTRPPAGPVLHQVVTDQLPSGPWSLWAGAAADQVTLELRLPTGATWREAGTAAVLGGRWTVASADGRHLLWGVTAADVETVTVTLSDGRVVSVPTVEAGLTGHDERLFAAQLPEALAITAAEGRRSDGSVAVRAEDVVASLEPVAGFDPAVTATVPVVPAEVPEPTVPPQSTRSTQPTDPSVSSTPSTGSAATAPPG
jgi:hypothetical protein